MQVLVLALTHLQTFIVAFQSRLFVTPWTAACQASLSPGVCSNSSPLSRWCHPTISSSVTPFSSCFLSFPASGSFPMSQLFTSGEQSTGASSSASVLSMNMHSWFPLGLTGLISLQSSELSRLSSPSQFKSLSSLTLHLLVYINSCCLTCRLYHFNGRKWRGITEPLESERGERKGRLKIQHLKKKKRSWHPVPSLHGK